jgi:hypothetical protein
VQMQAGEPAGSKLLYETMYSRTWEQDTSQGSFIGKTRDCVAASAVCGCRT